MKRIYLDHAAATPMLPEVLSAMHASASGDFGNPSSIHKEGVSAKKSLEVARGSIAETLGVRADEIVFIGSATESCNLALIGAVRGWKKAHEGKTPHVIVSAIEHDAVLAPARMLEAEGALLTILPVDQYGIVDMSALVSVITKDTVIISIGYANNEIGTIQPIREITGAVRNWKKDVRGTSRDVKPSGDDIYPLVHTDACQATNYCDIRLPQLGVDMLTMNAAKIYGPKGIALLALRRDIPIEPVVVGGGQEGGLRAGTENLPLIVGFNQALTHAVASREVESARLTDLRDALISGLSSIDGVCINGSVTSRLPNNVNFSLKDADHEFLVLALDAKDISVSTKSACNETDADTSHVLSALVEGGRNGGTSGIRVTLGRNTTKEDIETFLSVLHEIIDNLIVSVK